MFLQGPTHRIGSYDPEVGNWQRFLNEQGQVDFEGKALDDDETFGRRTAAATSAFQAREGLQPTGFLDALTRKRAYPLGFIPFVQAKHANILHPKHARSVRVLVVHTIECLEVPEAAENTALWFAGKTKYPTRKTSAHYCVDEDSVVQCVRDVDIAWHANQANDFSIGIEHAGKAAQTLEQWSDPKSSAILRKSAELAAKLCRKHQIPVSRLMPNEIRSGGPGFCGHVDVNHAFNNKGGNHDPGPAFPWDHYLALVRMAL